MQTYMRFVLLLLLSFLLVNCKKEKLDGANFYNSVPETAPAIQTAVTVDVTPNLKGFYKALPSYYDSTSKKYPLLIFVHGVGELGNGASDLKKVLVNGVPRLLEEKKFPPKFTINGVDYSFVVLSPQFKEWPKPADVNELINYAIKNFRIDEKRIYVSGLSMGGGATWEYAVNFPSRPAAIVPICGAYWSNKEQFAGVAKENLPVWAFHNEDDDVVGVGSTNAIIDFINSYSPSVTARKTIWPTGRHNSWSKATNPATKECEGKNMYEWMLTHSR
jgi:predicted peptidase